MLADREKDAAAGAMQLFGDLRARRAGADHQHRARRKLLGILVDGSHELKDGLIAQQIRHDGALIGAGGDHDIFRGDLAVGRFRDETVHRRGESRVTATPQRIGGATKFA